MKKPGMKTYLMYDWHECVAYINAKYDCNIRDFSGKFRPGAALDNSVPYQDFWHYFIDCHEWTHNGCKVTPDWTYMREDAEPWQRQIIDWFEAEFGSDPIFWIEW